MAQRKPEEFMLVEKKATNKVGLFVLFLIVLSVLGFGTFYLYKNNWKINFKIPWIKEKDNDIEKVDEEEVDNSGKKYNHAAGLNIPKISGTGDLFVSTNDERLTLKEIKADKNGYIFVITLVDNKPETIFKLKCSTILIDGFDTNTGFEIETNPNGEKVEIEVRINKTELNHLEINDFTNLMFYLDYEKNGQSRHTRMKIIMVQLAKIDNSKDDLITVDNKDGSEIYFYKKVVDSDYTYLYFDVRNKNSSANMVYHDLLIKKLLLNGKLYDYKDFKETIFYDSEKIFYLRIPRSEVYNIQNVSISFTIISRQEKRNDNIYFTSQSVINV